MCHNFKKESKYKRIASISIYVQGLNAWFMPNKVTFTDGKSNIPFLCSKAYLARGSCNGPILDSVGHQVSSTPLQTSDEFWVLV